MITFSLSLLLLTSCSGDEPKQVPFQVVSVDEVNSFLFREFDMESMRRRLETWKKASAYQVVSIAEYLLPVLLKDQLIETKKYRWQPGTHDLEQVAGRAAWALDELLGIKLSLITPERTRASAAQVQREAARAVEASFAWVSKAAENAKDAKYVEKLKARYHGKIKAGITREKSPMYLRTMNQFLSEWPPLGRKISDLQEIIGESGKTKGDTVTFRFDSGRGGFDFEFHTKQGVIRSVLIQGID